MFFLFNLDNNTQGKLNLMKENLNPEAESQFCIKHQHLLTKSQENCVGIQSHHLTEQNDI